MENSSFQKVLANIIGESLFFRLSLLFTSKDRAVQKLISSIRPLCRRDDTDELSSRVIIERVKDFMSMIPRDDEHKAMKYFQQFWLSHVSQDLASLLESPIKAKREAGEESIKVFLTPNINFLPKNIINYCARTVGDFCMHLRPPDGGTELPLYRSCRNTYRLLLKSIGYRNKKKYLYGEEPHQSMADLNPFVTELGDKLCADLKFIEESPLSLELPNSFRLSFENNLREFTLFSLHLRKEIEYHIKSEGHSIPVNSDEQLSSSAYIESFYLTTSRLNRSLDGCLLNLQLAICHAELKCSFNPRWLYYLSIMKEVNYISKL